MLKCLILDTKVERDSRESKLCRPKLQTYKLIEMSTIYKQSI